MSAKTPTNDPNETEHVFTVPNVPGFDSITLRRLRAMDKLNVGKRQKVMLGDLPTTFNLEVQEFSYMFALLEVALVEPKNFPFNLLEDEDLISLWREWDQWSKSFRRNNDGAVEDTSGPV